GSLIRNSLETLSGNSSIGVQPVHLVRRDDLASAESPSRRRGRYCLFALDFTEAQDCLDPGNLAFRLDDLAGCFEALGLALEAEPKQVVLNFLEKQRELLIGLLAKFGGLTHV